MEYMELLGVRGETVIGKLNVEWVVDKYLGLSIIRTDIGRWYPL